MNPAATASMKATSAIKAIRHSHEYGFRRKKNLKKKDVLDICVDEGVTFVNMQFIDVMGMPKAITMPIHKLADAIDSNVWFDGSSIEGFTRIFESDMYLKLDLDTFAVLPWTRETDNVTARIICDVYLPNGEPFAGCPRNILRRQVEEAKKLGYDFYTGPELEFFLFRKVDGKLEPLPHDTAGYFDQSTDLATDIRAEMSHALDEMGVEIEALHHEVAEGQHEIDFKYSDALTTADSAITFKMVVKAIAHKYDLHATFMPKPIAGVNGSGMHVHQSLFKDGKNAFYEPNGEYGLSDLALSYIAGQLKHVRSFNAIINPTVNSYKRLIAGYEAPVYVAWARSNRSALIRVPALSQDRLENGTRCELRCPDPTANPYLAFAVLLASGLDGIKNNMKAPAPVEEDIFHFTEAEVKKHKIVGVAENLKVAWDELRSNEVICDALGEMLVESLYAAKMAEWDAYRTSVSQWELDTYLETY